MPTSGGTVSTTYAIARYVEPHTTYTSHSAVHTCQPGTTGRVTPTAKQAGGCAPSDFPCRTVRSDR
jgi:hypothetical protein